MNKKTENQQARFDTRLTQSQKDFFERAALLGGYKTLSTFILQSAQEKASIIIEEHEQFLRSERDKEIFFNALLNPEEPNTELANAALEFKEKIKSK